MQDHESVISIIRLISIFAALPKEHLLHIIAICDERIAPTGTVLYEEGKPASDIFIILSGKVKLIKNYTNEPLEIIELDQGHSLGEASVIGIQDHSSTAITTDETKLLILSRKVLIELQQEDCQFFSILLLNIARELARRVNQYSNMLSSSATRHSNN